MRTAALLVIVLAGCWRGSASQPVAAGAVANVATTEACFAGTWTGSADDTAQSHYTFRIELRQAGTQLSGTFVWQFPDDVVGTEEVTGAANCVNGTATLEGGRVTEPAAPASYRLQLGGTSGERTFKGRWTCDENCPPGTLTGRLQPR